MDSEIDNIIKEEKVYIARSVRKVRKAERIFTALWWVCMAVFIISLIVQNFTLAWVFIMLSLGWSGLAVLCSTYLLGYSRGRFYQYLEERSKNDN